jgi:protein ImuB
MDALSLYLPTWSTDRIRRRLPPDSSVHRTPIVLTLIDRERTLVASCCALALSAGVRPGMPLAEARALVRTAIHVEPLSPADDRRDLQRLARWAYRFAPIVALDGDDGLLLDASGCAHLYGGIDRLLHRMLHRLRRAALHARLAAGPTFGSAWALARFGPGKASILVEPGQLEAMLADLPLAALRLDPASIDALHAVGVERIGQLRALPRSSIASRYAPHVLLRLDQAFGQALETITSTVFTRPTCVEHLFDGPTDRLESITLATQSLIHELAKVLAAKQRGSLSLRIELIRSDMEPLLIAVRTSQPCCDPLHLWKLLAPKLEHAHLGFGVQGVRLTVLRSKRTTHRQTTCWPGEQDRPAEVARLIDTLHARLGPDRVVRPIAFESHLPERAFAFAPVLEHQRALRPPVASQPVQGLPLDRPTLVLPSPQRIEVVLLAPDGPLVSIRSRGTTSAVRTCIGPERLAGEWWREMPGVGMRDYYKVHIDDGRWLWIFREAAAVDHTPHWFLHGEWA